MATTKRKTSTVDRDDEGRGRFVDQPGQIRDTTPASVKAKQKKAWDEYVAKYGAEPAKPKKTGKK